jgi:hypothetical protein
VSLFTGKGRVHQYEQVHRLSPWRLGRCDP